MLRRCLSRAVQSLNQREKDLRPVHSLDDQRHPVTAAIAVSVAPGVNRRPPDSVLAHRRRSRMTTCPSYTAAGIGSGRLSTPAASGWSLSAASSGGRVGGSVVMAAPVVASRTASFMAPRLTASVFWLDATRSALVGRSPSAAARQSPVAGVKPSRPSCRYGMAPGALLAELYAARRRPRTWRRPARGAPQPNQHPRSVPSFAFVRGDATEALPPAPARRRVRGLPGRVSPPLVQGRVWPRALVSASAGG